MPSRVTNQITITKPVMIENQQSGPTVFTSQGVEIVWEGHGDPGGEDVQAVPLSFLEDHAFLRAINRDIFKVYDAPKEVVELLEAQLNSPALQRSRAKLQSQRQAQADAQAGIMMPMGAGTGRPTAEDYVPNGCIGPASKGAGACGQEVVQKLNAKESKPPLCPKHQHLTSQCIEEETGEVVDGKAKTHWILATIEQRR